MTPITPLPEAFLIVWLYMCLVASIGPQEGPTKWQ